MLTCPDPGALALRSEDETVFRHTTECRRCRALVAAMDAQTGKWQLVNGRWVEVAVPGPSSS